MNASVRGACELLESLIVGTSAPVRRMRELLQQAAPTDSPVLIVGPTGAGKELVANGLHLASRRTGALVAFNVCAIADSMFEDALFGHVRGAFTGASADSAGYLVEAHRGTIFLDEISGLSLASQAKLLRAIETQSFRAVGARRDRSSDFRVIAASNEDLVEMSGRGKFRADLYFRLAGVVVRVPALAERREDIPILARAFLTHSRNNPPVGLEAAAVALLSRAEWPGNVRQLKHVVQLAAAIGDGDKVTAANVQTALDLGAPSTSRELLYTARESQVMMVLERLNWNVAAAASELQIHRSTLYRQVRRLKLKPEVKADE